MIIPINPHVKQRETKWICVCTVCQQERIITYSQKWNIETGKCKKECLDCSVRLGLNKYNLKGLELGKHAARIKRKPRTKKNSSTIYGWLFNPNMYITDSGLEKMRLAKLGKFGIHTNNWRGGLTDINSILRSRDDYKQWRLSVFIRDNYTCQLCNQIGGDLNADHIKEWRNFPELRYELSNGRTLCVKCHKKTDNYGSKSVRIRG